LLFLAPFNAANYTINGEPVSGTEFLRHAGLLFATLGLCSLAIAYAIWRERSWSRWAIIGFWAAQLAGAVGLGWAESGLGGAAAAVASLLLIVLLVAWYLFGKEDVVEYYRSLDKETMAHEARKRGAARDGA